jgi:hypothetical protein
VSRESRPRLQSGPKSGRFRCRSRERCSRWWPKRLPQQAWSKGLQRRLHGRVRPGRVADMEPPASGVCSGNGCPHGVAGLIALLHHVPQLVFHNASRASVIVPGVSRSIRPVHRNPPPLGFFFQGGRIAGLVLAGSCHQRTVVLGVYGYAGSSTEMPHREHGFC